jgi:hypothetical protein
MGAPVIEITPAKYNAKFGKLVKKDWAVRTNKMMQAVPYAAAHSTKRAILARIPDKEEYAKYKNSFHVAKIKGSVFSGGASYSVYSDVKAASSKQHHRDVDTTGSVVYVTPNSRRLAKKDPAVLVLQEFNPWTMDTIPFFPERVSATLIVRKVSEREMQSVAEDRKRQEYKWRKQLTKLGVKMATALQRQKQKKQVKLVPDIMFAAARLEFGSGNIKANPHWKPSIEEAVDAKTGEMAEVQKKFVKALGRFADTGWKKYPPKTATIDASKAKSFVPWQKRLGVRIG